MARRVRFFASQIEKEKEPIHPRPLYEQDMGSLITVGPRGPLAMDELDTKLAAHESRLLQMNESYETLSERLRELVEARHVLRETAVFFQQVRLVGGHSDGLVLTVYRPKGTKVKSGRPSTIVLHPYCNTMMQRTNLQGSTSQAVFNSILSG